jgi:hypothetical protein
MNAASQNLSPKMQADWGRYSCNSAQFQAEVPEIPWHSMHEKFEWYCSTLTLQVQHHGHVCIPLTATHGVEVDTCSAVQSRSAPVAIIQCS